MYDLLTRTVRDVHVSSNFFAQGIEKTNRPYAENLGKYRSHQIWEMKGLSGTPKFLARNHIGQRKQSHFSWSFSRLQENYM